MGGVWAWLIAASWVGPVVELLDNWSANLAMGVDMRGRCLTETVDPRKQAMRWRERSRIEAEMSFLTLRESQPKIIDSLSVSKMTSFPAMKVGQHRNGRIMPTASSVEDLHPYAWSRLSLACKRNFFGHMTLAQNQMLLSGVQPREAAPLNSSVQYGINRSPCLENCAPAASEEKTMA